MVLGFNNKVNLKINKLSCKKFINILIIFILFIKFTYFHSNINFSYSFLHLTIYNYLKHLILYSNAYN